ncbi:phosphotyrosyl phosphatase activator [Cordyceps fumosorosea ARSEF 2679]|uniref:Serine/threonine-protein phosphatase 2A activator n=1 Tax=Cordyceps fumosorosea (strain ARSEF 2679) TaxID=1081104 RepID=A0A162MZR9_CORFA|nr:phosphotyrosyl phosphatase activator [Cordyceps fumosorosea ARSEF 2679]OAA73189.1 phosphotyrosyl phosphatase activator [Cordyceps fumosorosea ARSEF 2679]
MASSGPLPSPAAAAPSASSIPNLKDRLPKLEPRKRRPPPTNPTPVPPTPPLPAQLDDPAGWTYAVPSRRILTRADLELFLASPTYDLLVGWVFGLADAVVDTPRSAPAVRDDAVSEPVRTLLAVLDEAKTLTELAPPNEQGGSRFGNRAFQGFVDLVRARAPEWHLRLRLDGAAAAEAGAYLTQSFGNRDRIDYGSGHELNFAVWLLCLYRARALGAADLPALALRVFPRYLAAVRAAQTLYYLEPAGSHGVWGLDDYQFLPFLLGAAQLLRHPYITPRAVHHDLTLEEAAPDYLYLDQVAFVNGTKTVRGLRWHSPMLDDISAARSWAKIDAGMRRMFVKEILGKLPVMQHFLFGSLVPAAEGMCAEEEVEAAAGGEHEGEEGHAGHAHDGKGWDDCCGIKVPSSIAAAQEIRKMGGADALRRIPFD